MNLEFLINILIQEKPSESLKKHEEETFKMIPELSICKGFNQNNEWHIYDVYNHILHVVDGVPNNINLRMVALFHDIGKPYVYKVDDLGIGHFRGHWLKSKEIFENFINQYSIENIKKDLISKLILYHDLNIEKLSEKELLEFLNNFNKEDITLLFQLKRSDLLAQNEKFHYLLKEYQNQELKLLDKLNTKL